MNERTIKVRNLWFTAHVIFYGLLGLITIFSYNSMFSTPFGPIFAFWTIFFFLHMRSYYLHLGRGGGIRDERQAYRDGFNDAIHMIRSGNDVPNRLMIDDDGELIEETEPEKRKYR